MIQLTACGAPITIIQRKVAKSESEAAAVEQSISYSKVILYIEIGGRAQSIAHFQGDC
jgi:hypothetical protein